ncbi:MAG TPA: prepilin peptidase, partial [Polyangiales bacterium]|nr:prepilin peptidase [Polyangiales bacterium]
MASQTLLVSDVPAWFVLGAAFAFGACWGSFFNVAIYRWPRDMSVVRPPSTCPSCGKVIAARYNVPIFGYLMLGGKTACCGTRLSPRYPAIELLSALLCVALARRYVLGAPPDTMLLWAAMITMMYFVFVGGLLVATFVDLEHMMIPDEVSLPGAAFGLATAVLRDPGNVASYALGA